MLNKCENRRLLRTTPFNKCYISGSAVLRVLVISCFCKAGTTGNTPPVIVCTGVAALLRKYRVQSRQSMPRADLSTVIVPWSGKGNACVSDSCKAWPGAKSRMHVTAGQGGRCLHQRDIISLQQYPPCSEALFSVQAERVQACRCEGGVTQVHVSG